MSEERRFKWGPYRLGRCREDIGPGLGRLYEARHAVTGTASLLLFPENSVEWQPQGSWQVRLSFQANSPTVRVDVEQAPPVVHLPELTNLFVLTTAAISRVEDDVEIEAHFARTSVNVLKAWMLALDGGTSLRIAGALAAFFVFAFSLFYGLCSVFEQRGRSLTAASDGAEESSQAIATQMVDSNPLSKSVIAYPLPSKPWPAQAVEPCYSELDEVALNGGCWMELGRKAPCLKTTQAEHEGKCYAPVTKERTPPRRSARP